MKKLLSIISIILCIQAKSQSQFNDPMPIWGPKPPTNKDTLAARFAAPKVKYTHILIYRTWHDWNNPEQWTYTTLSFTSLEKLTNWLNTPYWGKDYPDVRINQNELVLIYDLIKSSEIKVKLKSEKKVKPKEIIIEEETWTEKQYIIQK